MAVRWNSITADYSENSLLGNKRQIRCAPQILDLVQKYDIGNGSRTVREYAPKNLNAVLADHSGDHVSRSAGCVLRGSFAWLVIFPKFVAVGLRWRIE